MPIWTLWSNFMHYKGDFQTLWLVINCSLKIIGITIQTMPFHIFPQMYNPQHLFIQYVINPKVTCFKMISKYFNTINILWTMWWWWWGRRCVVASFCTVPCSSKKVGGGSDVSCVRVQRVGTTWENTSQYYISNQFCLTHIHIGHTCTWLLMTSKTYMLVVRRTLKKLQLLIL